METPCPFPPKGHRDVPATSGSGCLETAQQIVRLLQRLEENSIETACTASEHQTGKEILRDVIMLVNFINTPFVQRTHYDRTDTRGMEREKERSPK
ncbi:hypothetical protein UY3_02047 [Chelonia mydas]|uniref:Uncharacterized protein n=1 Tax=Chelonia mydas TaxID=8469 RepID=M7BY06_CHEMY|nr:hypothetical protein UY3_02047 [Chelonia mydas]